MLPTDTTPRTFRKIIASTDLAHFDAGAVHEVYSTFALARDAEWSGRLFVLDMKEADEEGIGTALIIEHLNPAFLGQEVLFTATLIGVTGTTVETAFEATVGERLIARGTQKQKILKKQRIAAHFESLRPH